MCQPLWLRITTGLKSTYRLIRLASRQAVIHLPWSSNGQGLHAGRTHVLLKDFNVLLCRLDTTMRAASCGDKYCTLVRVILD